MHRKQVIKTNIILQLNVQLAYDSFVFHHYKERIMLGYQSL
jgi:hypothetical protein